MDAYEKIEAQAQRIAMLDQEGHNDAAVIDECQRIIAELVSLIAKPTDDARRIAVALQSAETNGFEEEAEQLMNELIIAANMNGLT